MNLSKSNTVFSFGPYKHSLSANAYNVIEFAWPVKAFECYANKIESGSIDALALTVLELLNLQYLRLDQISDDLGISNELLEHIIVQELLSRGYCEQNKKEFRVTDNGAEYLKDINSNEICKEKVFGYMFQSLIDGEFFPFFYEGTLPDPWHNKDGLYYIDVSSKQTEQKEDSTVLLNKINRAYHKYGYIYHKSKEISEKSLFDENMFVDAEDDIQDQDFDYEADLENSSLSDEDKKELTNLKNARIKLLKTSPKELYIKFRLYALKDDPNFFQINSPFEENETKWYSESFARMRRDSNVTFGLSETDMIELESYCSTVTSQMYNELPELKKLNPEEYLERTYPELNSCSIKDILKKSYLRLVRQEIFAQKGADNESDVIMNVYRTLELLLNNYIRKMNKQKIIDSYFNYVGFESDIDDIQAYFGITDKLSAINTEKRTLLDSGNYFHKKSMMKNFSGNRNGTSLREKYYFLMYAAYLDKNLNFAKALREDKSIVAKIDYINYKRNYYAGHNQGYAVADVDSKLLKDIVTTFNELSSVLVSNFDR
ncbi:MAG: hypothetical protein SPE59_01410 [Treponema sp.]|nr:hypothetical protein [Treponema sp.]